MGKYVTAQKLDRWFTSDNRRGQGLFPEVIYRLVVASIPIRHRLTTRFLYRDEVRLPGFDGVVETDVSHLHVPNGVSYWEIGIGEPGRKITSDSESRADSDIDRAGSTFVFVSPHPWAKPRKTKEQRAEEIKEQGGWKDVRIYDSVDIATWLDATMAVDRWLATEMGVPVDSLNTLQGYFALSLRDVTEEARVDLVIGGRTDEQERICEWFKQLTGNLVVYGETVEEAISFLSASASKLPDDVREVIETTATVALSVAAADYIHTDFFQPPIIILTNEVFNQSRDAWKNFRLILVESDRNNRLATNAAVVALGPLKRQAIQQALIVAGKQRLEGEEISKQTKGSFTALTWMLAIYPQTPIWSQGKLGARLALLLLTKQWRPAEPSDVDVVTQLTGIELSEIEQEIAEWSIPRGPFIRRGPIIDWVALGYSWSLLGKYLNERVLHEFIEVAKKVLSEPDPALELDPDQRWAASTYGKRLKHSEWLRDSIVSALGQLSILELKNAPDTKSVAVVVVRHLLSGDELDRAETWMSLAPHIPDLAEAAPDMFLHCLDDFIKDSEANKEIFTEEGFMGHSRHVHLLWALERLAWDPKYLSQAAVALARLAKNDPGGKLTNRPMNSLADIFLPWFPHTEASVEQRILALQAVADCDENVAWRLVVNLMPSVHGFTSGTATPRLRPPANERRNVLQSEYTAVNEALVTNLLGWAPHEPSRWVEVVSAYEHLTKPFPFLAARLAAAMATLDPTRFDDEQKLAIRNIARNTLGRHRQFPNTDWAMDANQLKVLADLYDRLFPEDAVAGWTWVFVSWPEMQSGRDIAEDIDGHFSEIDDERRKGMAEIIGKKGIKGIEELVERVERPDEVGRISFSLLESNPEWQKYLATGFTLVPDGFRYPPKLNAAISFLTQGYATEKCQYVERFIKAHTLDSDANAMANIALALPAMKDTWAWLYAVMPTAVSIYWSRVDIYTLQNPEEDASAALRALADAKRYYRAIDVAYMGVHRANKQKDKVAAIETDILLFLLRTAPTTDPSKEPGGPNLNMLGHHVAGLLDVLQQRGVPRRDLAMLEWMWLPFLESTRRKVGSFQAELASDPDLYMELISAVFRSKDTPREEVSERDRQRATLAYRALHAMTWVPGTDAPGPMAREGNGDIPLAVGPIDEKRLNEWVEAVRDKAKATGREEITDSQIGNLLAYAPGDPDGTWPAKAVRDLIERIASNELDGGISTGLYNRRGAHFVVPGGEQEKQLAGKFDSLSRLVEGRWPRTAAILRSLSKSLARDADMNKRNDEFREYQ